MNTFEAGNFIEMENGFAMVTKCLLRNNVYRIDTVIFFIFEA